MMRLCHLLLLVVAACYIGSPASATKGDTTRVLFIGNSLTYTNDLPGLVEEIGLLDGKTLACHSISLPDYSLEDHWINGNAEAEIEKGIYDIVILQQGPSALPESQALLLGYADRFTKICEAYHSKVALYMVWPSKNRLFDLEAVIRSYANAAKRTGALLCPAGLAWKKAWEADPALRLYGPDDFHPGIDGSVLAALTIYSVITEKKGFAFLQWEKTSWKNRIDPETLELLKAAAEKAIQ